MLGLVVLLLLVAALGVLAFRRLEAIIDTAASASMPANDRLVLVRSLVADLNDAEKHRIMYALSREEDQLTAFAQTKSEAHKHLGQLGKLPHPTREEMNQDTRLGILVREKLNILEAQIALSQALLADSVLDRLSQQMHEMLQRSARVESARSQPSPSRPAGSATKDKPQPAPEPEDPKRLANAILRWVMGVPREEQPAASAKAAKTAKAVKADTAKPAASKGAPVEEPMRNPSPSRTVLPMAVEQSLQDLAKAQSESFRDNLQRDLALTQRSQKVSEQIRDLTQAIEMAALKAAAEKSRTVKDTAQDANRWIIAFCIVFPLFLLLITLAIVRYLRTLRAHDAAISAAKSQAEALAEARARFLSTMSHEIRTPMNAIIGFGDQLLQSRLDPEQRSQMQLVHHASQHLLDVVNSVLDFSRLEAGQMQYACADFDLRAEVGLVTALLRSQYVAKGLRLDVELPGEGPVYLKGDALRLRQVLINLLGNALKFTEKGGATLSLALEAEADGHRRLHVTVRDTGIGIAEDRLGAVFQAFEQGDASIGSRFGGSGLGLAITKLLVEQQGGTIRLQSKLGVGTTVEFELAFAEGEAVAAEVGSLGAWQLRGRRALIADDEPFNLRLLESLLGGWGMECVQAADGRAALAAAANGPFDILLFDLRMPEMDGLAATRALRAQPAFAQVPIAILTASTQDAVVAACKEAGANAVLPKPLDARHLQAAILDLLGLEPMAPAEPPLDDKAPKRQAAFSLDALNRMAQSDAAFVAEMVESFIAAAERTQERLREAVAATDLVALGEAAHRLAAPAKHLQAHVLYRQLKALEAATDWAGALQWVAEIHEELATLLPALRAASAQPSAQPKS